MAKAKNTTPATTAPEVASAPSWDNLGVVATLEVADGKILNPYDKSVIAMADAGLLDVKRPGGDKFPKPDGVKATADNLAVTFSKWYYNSCYAGSPVKASEVIERFGLKTPFNIPAEVNLEAEAYPFAVVTGNLGADEWVFIVLNGHVVRVGRVGAKSILWVHSTKMLEERGPKMCPRAISTTDANEAFKAMMSSFTGKFAHHTGAGEAKTEKAEKPEKAAKPEAPKAKAPKPAAPAPVKAAPKLPPIRK